MKELTKIVTIRMREELYEKVEEIGWQERKRTSELIRELIELGLEAKIKGGNN